MKRASRFILAFLWLTVGYWIFSFVLQFALVLSPFAQSGSGISESASNGVHTVQFSGAPGDAVLVLVTQGGDHKVTFHSSHPDSSGSSTTMVWASAYLELFLVIAYALVSLPILSRLLRHTPNTALEPTATAPSVSDKP